jgi:hypothetical protein
MHLSHTHRARPCTPATVPAGCCLLPRFPLACRVSALAFRNSGKVDPTLLTLAMGLATLFINRAAHEDMTSMSFSNCNPVGLPMGYASQYTCTCTMYGKKANRKASTEPCKCCTMYARAWHVLGWDTKVRFDTYLTASNVRPINGPFHSGRSAHASHGLRQARKPIWVQHLQIMLIHFEALESSACTNWWAG